MTWIELTMYLATIPDYSSDKDDADDEEKENEELFITPENLHLLPTF